MEAVAPARLMRASHAEIDDIAGSDVTLISAGKAARPMASAFAEMFVGTVSRALVAGAGDPTSSFSPPWQVLSPSHPFPDGVSVEAGERALRLAGEARSHLMVVLLSGGASSMLCAPSRGITVEDKIATTRALMDAGVGIDGLNCVRKHLSAIKGGQLAALAGRSLTLAISDVHYPVQDDPAVIGSGPTVADPTTFRAALQILSNVTGVPKAATRHLERGAAGELPETPKPGDERLARADFRIVGNRRTALDGAMRRARALGYAIVVLDEATHGEARRASEQFVEDARLKVSSVSRPLCMLAAGETTVRVVGQGLGGRNQEFSLAAVPHLESLGSAAVLASVGTDGQDGPTDAAGAVADSTTARRASSAALDWTEALANNDAYRFFAALGDLIISGPTGTNVGDVQVLLVA